MKIKTYEKPIIEVINFENENIITTSDQIKENVDGNGWNPIG